jgi:hypothetical protein
MCLCDRLLVVAAIGYGLYALIEYFIEPSSSSISSAKPNFQTYSQVTQLAPIGSQPSKNRFCDYYVASSSYSVFPGAKIYDYISDGILEDRNPKL